MATLDDVSEIAAALPDATNTGGSQVGGVAWRTRKGLFVWERGPTKADLSQLAALGRSWQEGSVVGLRTDGLEAKEMLLASLPGVLFTIPHFDGYPAVLCRLNRIDREQLAEFIVDAWLCRVSKRVAKEWLTARGLASGKNEAGA